VLVKALQPQYLFIRGFWLAKVIQKPIEGSNYLLEKDFNIVEKPSPETLFNSEFGRG